MKINREVLLRSLEAAEPGLSQRDLLEQSSCFVFRKGRVYTFNDEVAVRCKTPLDPGVQGAVPAAKLLKMLRRLREEEVEVVCTNHRFKVEIRPGEFFALRMEADIQLPIDEIERPESWRPIPQDFAEAVGAVQGCAGSAGKVGFLMECVHINPGWIEACDNYQLCRWAIDTGLQEPTLVKRTAVVHVCRLGATHLSLTPGWLHFKNAEGTVLSCRRYTEDYEDLTGILNVQGAAAKLPKGLSEAIARAETFSADNPEANLVYISLRPKRLVLRGEGPDGEYRSGGKTSYAGPPLEFRIAPGILSDLVKKHNLCTVSSSHIKVETGKYKYVSCLTAPDNEEESSEINGRLEKAKARRDAKNKED